MALVIPTENITGQQTLEITLASVAIRIQLQYLERSGAWSVDYFDSLGDPINVGRALFPAVPFNARYADPRLPDGVFFPVRRDGTHRPFGPSEVSNGECIFFYVPRAEWNAAIAAGTIEDYALNIVEVMP